MGLHAGNAADGGSLVHAVADIDGMLLRHILRLHPFGELIRDSQRDRAVFRHGCNQFFGQMLLGGKGLRPPGLRNVKDCCKIISICRTAVLSFIRAIDEEGVPGFAGTHRASGLIPHLDGAGMGDVLILLVQEQEVSGTLRRTPRHKAEEAPHRLVIPEHLLGLGVYPRPHVLALRLFHGRVFLFGQPGFFLPWFLPIADQIGYIDIALPAFLLLLFLLSGTARGGLLAFR